MTNRAESGAESARHGAGLSPAVGARVWLLREGGFGRVIARGHGGLTCRVRLERDHALVECAGCEILPLSDAVAG